AARRDAGDVAGRQRERDLVRRDLLGQAVHGVELCHRLAIRILVAGRRQVALADVGEEEGDVQAALRHLRQVHLRRQAQRVVAVGGEVPRVDVVVRFERDDALVDRARPRNEVRLGVQRRGQTGRRRREGERRPLHKGCSSSADVTMCAMIRFARPTPSVLAFLLAAVSLAAQTDVTGEWEASYATPLGPQELKIYLTQEGPRISGHTTSEYGESQVR